MNKLEGFYELQKSGLPSVPWKEYKLDTVLDDKILWTIRSAVTKGDDLNLPRIVGVNAFEAKQFADKLLATLGEYDLVLYYPYFIADKSGVMEVASDRVVIEAVKDDLWNLVTLNNRNITIIISEKETSYYGQKDFLTEKELTALVNYYAIIIRKFKTTFLEGKSIFLEWSFAFKSDLNKKPIGEKELIFYEIRSV